MVHTRLVDLAQDVLGHRLFQALDLLHLVVLDQLLVEAELLRQLVHDHVVGAALPQRLHHALAPLDRAVGRGARAAGFELRRGRQQVDRPVGVEVVLACPASPPSPRWRSGTDRSPPADRACPSPASSRGRASASSARGPRRTCRAGCCSWSISSFFSSTPSIQRDTVMPGLFIMPGAYCFLIHSKSTPQTLAKCLNEPSARP